MWHTGGDSIVFRLREGVERFTITDVNNPAGSAHGQSSIPVMLDTFADRMQKNLANDIRSQDSMVNRFNHLPGGCNVLYMDGHVEFIKYPARYPVSQYVAANRIGGDSSLGFGDNWFNDMDKTDGYL